MTKTTLAAALCGTLFLAFPAYAEDTLRLSVTSALPGHHTALSVFRKHFQAEVSRRMEDAGGTPPVWVEMHDGSLARPGGVLEALEDDLVLFGIVSVNEEVDRLPLQNLTYRMPFTTEDCAVVAEAYHNVHETVEGMTGPVEKAGQMYLAPITSDAYNFISVQKITNPGDVRGIPIGIVDKVEGWLSGVEGAPVPIRADLIASRLEAGVLIGALMPDTDMRRLGLKEQADHYTRTGFGAQVPYIVTVNARLLADLPEAVREAVRATASAFTVPAAKAYCAAGESALEKLKEQGIRTAKLLKSRRGQWAGALAPLAQSWAKRNDDAGWPGTAAVEAYMQELKAAGVHLTRDWSRPASPGALPVLTPPAEQVSEAPHH